MCRFYWHFAQGFAGRLVLASVFPSLNPLSKMDHQKLKDFNHMIKTQFLKNHYLSFLNLPTHCISASYKNHKHIAVNSDYIYLGLQWLSCWQHLLFHSRGDPNPCELTDQYFCHHQGLLYLEKDLLAYPTFCIIRILDLEKSQGHELQVQSYTNPNFEYSDISGFPNHDQY